MKYLAAWSDPEWHSIANTRQVLQFQCLPIVDWGGIALGSRGGILPRQTFREPVAPYRVVFAVTVNDQHVWNEGFANFLNIQSDLGRKNVAIEMVVYDEAIAMLKFDSLVFNKVEQALKDGVKIVACENT